ncbi:Uncharacterised protein [Klebsiella pneumoniae]|nr:Uncharacterised protein [Klebsiella pneumoniae]
MIFWMIKNAKNSTGNVLLISMFHTVRSGSDTEIQSVIKECSESGLDFKDVKHDYLLEYFDSFHNRFTPPSIPIIKLLISYQNNISHKAKLAFCRNIYYRGILKEEELYEISELIIK